MQSLFVCYISGLDLRRVNAKTTPFLAAQLDQCPWRRFVNLPSNELFPTLFTGVDPTVHGVWGVKLRPQEKATAGTSLVDCLPDGLTTTFQGILHFLTGRYDLAAIPPRRRRCFDITRTKYKRRNNRHEALFDIRGIPSVFSVIGEGNCRYIFSSALDPTRYVLRRLHPGQHVIDLLELYSLDRYQQFNLDRLDAVLSFYGRIDEFLSGLHEKCQAANTPLLIISDHGHEPIRESIDLVSRISDLGIPENAYHYFVEVSHVRFWFHTEEARKAITRLLSEIENGTVVHFREMHRFGVPLKDASYGEVFCYLDPGSIFFPHDFHHGIANLWLGLTDPMQRSRFRDPRHKGNHGHLPHFDTENAFVALFDERFEVRVENASILDVAPSILSVLGYDRPSSMTGHALFQPGAMSTKLTPVDAVMSANSKHVCSTG